MSTFRLPDLGEGLTEAEIRQWHVKVGDTVAVDDPLVSLETAKAIVEVPSPLTGVVSKCYGNEGDVIETNAPLVDVDDGRENEAGDIKIDKGTVVGEVLSSNEVIVETAMGFKPQLADETSHAKATPAIRMLAHRLGIEINNMIGTGPRGAITRKDLEAEAKKATPSAATESKIHVENLSAVDRYMAELMIKSHQEVVPVTLSDDADITHWQDNEDMTVRMIKAISHACQTEPHLNAHFDSEHLTRTLFDDVNLGMAVDTEHGLFVPVLQQVQIKSNEALRDMINAYKESASARTLTKEQMHGASIVLTNFGAIAGKYANPIVVPPAVAIVGVGHRFERASTAMGTTEQHQMLPLSLTFDHRAVTGGQASRFMAALVKALAEQ